MLSAHNVVRTYRKHRVEIPVLQGLSIDVQPGEFLSIVGQSGSGKSTLLHVLGTLDRPDGGEVIFEGRRIDNLDSRRRDYLRNQLFGFVFQFYHLLPELSAIENILIPQMIHHSVFGWWMKKRAMRQRAQELLERVGLGDRAKHKPRELSGGEMQRAAIARALINEPRVLLADEPTGNLDEATGRHIMDLLHDLNERDGLTIIMVTHNQDLAVETDRIVRLTHGRVEVQPREEPKLSLATGS